MVACSKYSAGDLKAKITISRKTTAADGMGGVSDTWVVIGSPWAMWRALSGNEAYAAQRINPRVKVKAVIRFKGDGANAPFYGPQDKVTYKGRDYAVMAVLDVDDSETWLELSLDEGAPA